MWHSDSLSCVGVHVLANWKGRGVLANLRVTGR